MVGGGISTQVKHHQELYREPLSESLVESISGYEGRDISESEEGNYGRGKTFLLKRADLKKDTKGQIGC